MAMPNFLPSYRIVSPIETLTQMLESDHVEHIFLKHMLRISKPEQQNEILNLPVLGSF
jgi:hypothetical protein